MIHSEIFLDNEDDIFLSKGPKTPGNGKSKDSDEEEDRPSPDTGDDFEETYGGLEDGHDSSIAPDSGHADDHPEK